MWGFWDCIIWVGWKTKKVIRNSKSEEKYIDNYEEYSNIGDDGCLEYESKLGY